MILTKHDALSSLKPNAKWRWVGFDYSGLEWQDSSTKPTETEINDELTRLNNLEPMTALREYRDMLLEETDWVVTKAAETGVAETDAWKTYRQALRDMTKQTPKLDSNNKLDLTSVTWPTKPS
tara:strand:+ start:810 stop:1178 length:369 start_codon:yes stop_codon:yes gene_type:complete